MTGGGNAEFVLRYEITPDAVIDALRLQQARLPWLYTRATLLMIFSAVVMVVVAVPFETVRGLLLLAAAVVLSGAATTAIVRWRRFMRWSLRRWSAGYFGEAEVHADVSELRIRTPSRTTILAWKQLTGLRADRQTVLLERHRLMAAWIPTDAFETPEQRTAFIAFAETRIASSS